jgi:hypothetical protein
MKTFTLSLLATFCTLLAFGQDLATPSATILSQAQAISQNPVSSDNAQFASIENTKFDKDYYMNTFRESGGDRCAKAKKMKTIGIILASVGGGVFFTGIALVAIGVHDDANYGYNGNTGYYGGTDGSPLVAGGAVLMVLGVGGMGAGIPLAIIGSVKSHKYCGSGSERSYMQLSTKGNGLALNF